MAVTVGVRVCEGLDIARPQYRTPAPPANEGDRYSTTGIAAHLETAVRQGVGDLVFYVSTRYDLTRTEAYALCSVAGDLEINELVNEPNVVVSARLPERVLP